MGPLDQLIHLTNFLAPALAVALVLAIVGPWFMSKSPSALGIITQAA